MTAGHRAAAGGALPQHLLLLQEPCRAHGPAAPQPKPASGCGATLHHRRPDGGTLPRVFRQCCRSHRGCTCYCFRWAVVTACWSSLVQQPLCLLPCLRCCSKGRLPWLQVKAPVGCMHCQTGWGNIVDILRPVPWVCGNLRSGFAEPCGAPSQHFSLQFGQMLKASVFNHDSTTHNTQSIQEGELRCAGSNEISSTSMFCL